MIQISQASIKQALRQVFKSAILLKDNTSNVAIKSRLSRINRILDECDNSIKIGSNKTLTAAETSFYEVTKQNAELISRTLFKELECVEILKSEYMNDLQKQVNKYKTAIKKHVESGGKQFYDLAITLRVNDVLDIDSNAVIKEVFDNLLDANINVVVFDTNIIKKEKVTEKTFITSSYYFNLICKELNRPLKSVLLHSSLDVLFVDAFYILPSVANDPVNILSAQLKRIKNISKNKPIPIARSLTFLGYLTAKIATKFSVKDDSDLDRTILLAFDQMGNYIDPNYRESGIEKSSQLMSAKVLKQVYPDSTVNMKDVPFNVRTHLEYLEFMDSVRVRSKEEAH
ncbi:hypothetical protein [Psychromonas sp. SP041]|uniref:hypothetical protein n=1 Tax=Psychromonas sp. SP041 TaxID=1365007 RepID=UPI0010C78B77|nr:hypothetical protein [Psychromonas sp. SP041]